MGMAVVVGMAVAMAVVLIDDLERAILAKACAIAVRITLQTFLGAHAFHVVMMALLHCAHFRFKAQNCCAVFAHLAIHGDVAGDDLFDAFDKGFDN